MTTPAGARFPADVRSLIADAREIGIETWRDDSAPHHRTIIWPIVDEQGRVLVRSVRGAEGRWYREAVANPTVVMHLRGRDIPAGAVVASDEGRIQAASDGYRSKYGPGSSTESMLRESVLATTLELIPPQGDTIGHGVP